MPRRQAPEDHLINCLHRAALDRVGWQHFVSALELEFNGAKASIHGAMGPRKSPFLSVSGSFDPDFALSYLAHYQHINPFMPLSAAIPEGQVRMSPSDITQEKLRSTEFYNDWLRPQEDLSFAVALKSNPHQGRTVVLSLNIRQQDCDKFAVRAQQVLERLEPHVSHAFQVAETISTLSARSRNFDGSNSWAGGMLMLDEKLSLLWAEPEAISHDGEVFRVNALNRVTFCDSAVQHWATAVSRSHGKAAGLHYSVQGTGGWRIRFVKGMEEHIYLPSPFFGGCQFSKAGNLFLLSKQIQAAPLQKVLQARFGLTSTEVKIAEAISSGQSTEEIAAARQVSRHTVRNQVRSVLDKMDARHRIDVTRILMNII